MYIDKFQSRLKALNAESPDVKHTLQAWIFTDRVEFAVCMEEEMSDGPGVVEGADEQVESEYELHRWAETGNTVDRT